jgi:amino acid transporter
VTTKISSRSTIGFVSLVCLIIGNMIGSAVYISSSYALGALGDARLVLLAWLIGGLHATCGAIAYAALARRVRLSGGEYSFLSRYVHPAIGLMAGWISLTAGFAAPVAAAALVLGEYMMAVPEPTWQARILATGWIALCAGFHMINLRTGSWVNNGVIALKLIGFTVFAVTCAIFLFGANETQREAFALRESFLETSYLKQLLQPSVWFVIAVQLFFISLAYTGFNASIYIAEEVHDTPPRDNQAHDIRALGTQISETSSNTENSSVVEPSPAVWRSMIAACLFVMIIYLVLNALFLACSTPERIIAGGDFFVSDVAYDIGGDWLKWVMRITIAISSATSVLAMTATGPRVYSLMANDGWLPKVFSPSTEVPRMAIFVQAVVSAVFVWIATVKDLVDYLGLTLTACGAVATSTLWLAHREMNAIRPIRWWEHLALALYIVGASVLLLVATQIKPIQLWLCLGTFALGILVYVFSGKRR